MDLFDASRLQIVRTSEIIDCPGDRLKGVRRGYPKSEMDLRESIWTIWMVFP